MRRFLVAASLVCAFGAGLVAQAPASGRWFGVMQPHVDQSDLHHAVVDVSSVNMNKALLSKTVMVVNVEHVAPFAIHIDPGRHDVDPNPWMAEGAEQQMSFAVSNQSPFLIELGHRARERYGFNIGNNFGSNVPGDLGGYAPLGVARVQSIHSGPMYHTSGDTLDTISIPGLERAARFYAYFVSEAAKAPRASIDPVR